MATFTTSRGTSWAERAARSELPARSTDDRREYVADRRAVYTVADLQAAVAAVRTATNDRSAR